MNEKTKSAWKAFIKNIDSYLGICISIIVTLLSIFGILKLEIVVAVILFLLSLIAFQALQDRSGRETLRTSIEHLKSSLAEPSPIDLFKSWSYFESEYRNRLTKARKFSVLAVSPLRLVLQHQNEIQDILSRVDGQIRFLLVDPEEVAMDLVGVGRKENQLETRSLFKNHLLPFLDK